MLVLDLDALTGEVARSLEAAADPRKAEEMAAYLKSDMPFRGVQKPARKPILRAVVDRHPPATAGEYRDAVNALWRMPHREEKYLALGYARHFDRYVGVGRVSLFRRLVREGAWWDLVDETAIHLIGRALAKQRVAVTPTVETMMEAPSLWERRTAIICQIGHREATDCGLLFAACTTHLDEGDFFIRKAIGWALREYAKTDEDAVRFYVAEHRERMSALSIREATKHFVPAS